MSKQMAHKVHYHPGQSEPCVVEEEPRHWTDWFLLGVCAVVAVGALWLLLLLLLAAAQ